jgi:hypothetical protein
MLFLLTTTTRVVRAAAGDGPCVNSTEAILVAQATVGQTEFWICPNTTIDIGIPGDATFTTFVNGDFPLSSLLNDVSVQCGLDGKSSNNCVLNGGLYQLITTPANPFLPNPVTTNNLKIKGITFSGTVVDIPVGVNKTYFGGSLNIGAPGTNMVFEDCIFTDLAGGHVMAFQKDDLSAPEDFPAQTADVLFKNCKFNNIAYQRYFIFVDDQTLRFDNVEFTDIAYQASECDCNRSGAIYVKDSTMDMTDCTFENFEYLSGLIYAQGNDTDFTYSGLTGSGITIVDQATRPADDYCVGGLIIEKIKDGKFDECLDLFANGSNGDSGGSLGNGMNTTTGSGSGGTKGSGSTVTTIGRVLVHAMKVAFGIGGVAMWI